MWFTLSLIITLRVHPLVLRKEPQEIALIGYNPCLAAYKKASSLDNTSVALYLCLRLVIKSRITFDYLLKFLYTKTADIA